MIKLGKGQEYVLIQKLESDHLLTQALIQIENSLLCLLSSGKLSFIYLSQILDYEVSLQISVKEKRFTSRIFLGSFFSYFLSADYVRMYKKQLH